MVRIVADGRFLFILEKTKVFHSVFKLADFNAIPSPRSTLRIISAQLYNDYRAITCTSNYSDVFTSFIKPQPMAQAHFVE